jgi:predicted transcriptional regulator
MSKKNPEQYLKPAWLMEQYVEQGRTMASIALELGVAVATVRNYLVRADIERRPRGRKLGSGRR